MASIYYRRLVAKLKKAIDRLYLGTAEEQMWYAADQLRLRADVAEAMSQRAAVHVEDLAKRLAAAEARVKRLANLCDRARDHLAPDSMLAAELEIAVREVRRGDKK